MTEFEDLLHRNCEMTLRRLCGRASLLPKSISLSESDIERTTTTPSCGGGFADVYEGVYLGKPVALKVLRVYGKDNIRKVQKVRSIFLFAILYLHGDEQSLLSPPTEFLQGGCFLAPAHAS